MDDNGYGYVLLVRDKHFPANTVVKLRNTCCHCPGNFDNSLWTKCVNLSLWDYSFS